MSRFARIAFTPQVRAVQERMGSRSAYARVEAAADAAEVALGEEESAFLAARDSFYLASVSETGWPYVQHRGGPKGFVCVVDPRTLAFADYRGNRQYVSVGNVAEDDRVALLFVDYPRRARLKVLARAEIVEAAARPDVVAALTDLAPAPARARVERAFVLHVEAFDWNCPQHITPRYTEEELRPVLEELELENRRLRAELAAARDRGVTSPARTR